MAVITENQGIGTATGPETLSQVGTECQTSTFSPTLLPFMPNQAPNPDSEDDSIVDSGPTDSADVESSDGDSTNVESAAEPVANDDTNSEAESAGVDDLQFDDDHLGETLRHATEEKLDNAPFGIIRVDDEGIVEFFNQYEAELSGMDPAEVLGKNFFTQVAPCTNNRLFRGRFKKGVRRDELDETFTYTYTYKMRPTLVDVRLYRDESGQNWITVQKY